MGQVIKKNKNKANMENLEKTESRVLYFADALLSKSTKLTI